MVLASSKNLKIASDLCRFTDKTIVIGECWEWTGAVNQKGYPMFWLDGKMIKAHRWIYSIVVGKLIAGLVIDHICHNRSCVNPDHLRQITVRQNNQNRKVSRGIYFRKSNQKWRAQISVDGKTVHVGIYDDEDIALEKARQARIQHYTHNDVDRQTGIPSDAD